VGRQQQHLTFFNRIFFLQVHGHGNFP
jgi:hypothetical protein